MLQGRRVAVAACWETGIWNRVTERDMNGEGTCDVLNFRPNTWYSRQKQYATQHACGKAILPDLETAVSVYRIISSAKLAAGSNLPTQTWWGQGVWQEYEVQNIGSEGEWWMSDSDLFFLLWTCIFITLILQISLGVNLYQMTKLSFIRSLS